MANALTYVANLGKSIKYSAVDTFKEMNPTITTFKEDNSDFMKSINNTIKSVKLSVIGKKIEDSQVGKLAKTAWTNVWDDIKTGKLYNKEREDKIESGIGMKMMGFDDGDFGLDLDNLDNFDFDEDDTSDDDGGTSSNEMMDIVAEKATMAISSTVAKSSRYVVSAQQEMNKTMATQQNILFGRIHADMGTINTNVANIIEFAKGAASTHYENSKTFYESSNALDKERNDILKEMLEIQKKNGGVEENKRSSRNKVTFSDIVNGGVPNLEEYIKYIKQNISNNSTGMGDLVSTMMESGAGDLMVASPLKAIPKMIIKTLTPKFIRTSMESLNKSLAGVFGSVMMKLASGNGGGIGGTLADMLGMNMSLKKSMYSGKYKKEAIPFDGITKKAIIEVIPTYLSKILTVVSGQNETRYNYDEGKFINIEKLNKTLQDISTKNAESAASMSDVTKYLDEYKENLKMNNKDRKQLNKDIKAILTSTYKNARIFNTRSKSANAATYGLKGGQKSEVNMKLIKAMFDSMPNYIKHQWNTEILSQRDSQNQQMKRDEENGENVLFNLFNESAGTNSAFESKGIKTKYRPSNKEIKFKKPGDNEALNVLKNIYKEVSYIRTYGSGDVPATKPLIDSTIDTKKATSDNTPIKDDNKKKSMFSRIRDKINNPINKIKKVFNKDKEAPTATPENGLDKASKAASKSVSGTSSVRNEKPSFESFKVGNDVKNKNKNDKKKKNKNTYKKYYDTKDDAIDYSSLDSETANQIFMERLKSVKKDELKKKEKKSIFSKIQGSEKAGDKVKLISKNIDSILSKPAYFINTILNKVDESIYDLIYGPKGKGDQGILKNMIYGIKSTFTNLNIWLTEKIIDPLSKKLTKENMHNSAKNLFAIFGLDLDDTIRKTKEFFFGKKEDSVRITNGIFGGFIDGVKDSFKKAGGWLKDSFKSIFDWIGISGKLNKDGKNKDDENQKIKEFLKTMGIASTEKVKTDTDKDIPNAASGMKKVSETGIVAVSEGEMIVPPDLNPFNIKKRKKNENKAKDKFSKATGIKSSSIKGYSIGKLTPQLRKYLEDEEKYKKLNPKIRKKIVESIIDSNGELSTDILNEIKNNPDSMFAKNVEDLMNNAKQKHTKDDYEKGNESFKFKFIDETKNLKDFIFNQTSDIKDGVKKKANDFKKVLYGGSTEKEQEDSNKKDSNAFKNALDDIMKNIKKYAPDATAGALIGGGVSLFTGIIGGPLLGAATGAAISLVKNSDKVQKMLFGDKVNDEYLGGLLSKELSNNINKYVPSIGKGATVGAITSLLPFIPGGPVAGIIVGSAAGFASKNEKIQSALFGDEGALKGLPEYFKKTAPRMGLGAIAGIAAGPFGFGTNILLGSILGFASDTNKFKDVFFGEKDENGNRVGGVLGYVKTSVSGPITDFAKNTFTDLRTWFKDDVIKPVTEAFTPIKKQIELMFKSITRKLISTINDKLGNPLGKIAGFITGKLGKLFGGLFNVVKGVGKTVFSIPSKIIGNTGKALKARQVKRGTADYMTADERLQFREDNPGWINRQGQDRAIETDQLISGMNLDQLKEARTSIGYAKNAKSYAGKEIQSSKKELQKSVINNKSINIRASRHIKKLINNGEYEKALDYIDKLELPTKDKEYMKQKIAVEGKRLKTAIDYRNDIQGTQQEMVDKLKGMGFKDISYKNFDDIESLFKTEIKSRSVTGDKPENIETPESEASRKADERHKEVIDIINEAVDQLKNLNRVITGDREADPDELEFTPTKIAKVWGKKVKRRPNKKDNNDNNTTNGDGTGETENIPNAASGMKRVSKTGIVAVSEGEMIVPPDLNPFNIKKRKKNENKAKDKFLSNLIPGYAEGGETEEGALSKLVNSIKNKSNKAKETITQFYNGLPIRYVRSKDGKLHIDKSDSDTSATLKIREDDHNIQKSILSGITSIPGKIIGFFGGGDKKGKDGKKKGNLFSKILRAASIATLVGAFLPKIIDFVKDKVAPWIVDKFTKLKDGFITGFTGILTGDDNNSLSNKIGEKLGEVIGKAKRWLFGETEGGGFPVLYKDKIIPMALHGYEEIMTNVVPKMAEIIIESIPSIIKGLGKGLNGLIKGLWKAGKNGSDSDPDKIFEEDSKLNIQIKPVSTTAGSSGEMPNYTPNAASWKTSAITTDLDITKDKGKGGSSNLSTITNKDGTVTDNPKALVSIQKPDGTIVYPNGEVQQPSSMGGTTTEDTNTGNTNDGNTTGDANNTNTGNTTIYNNTIIQSPTSTGGTQGTTTNTENSNVSNDTGSGGTIDNKVTSQYMQNEADKAKNFMTGDFTSDSVPYANIDHNNSAPIFTDSDGVSIPGKDGKKSKDNKNVVLPQIPMTKREYVEGSTDMLPLAFSKIPDKTKEHVIEQYMQSKDDLYTLSDGTQITLEQLLNDDTMIIGQGVKSDGSQGDITGSDILTNPIVAEQFGLDVKLTKEERDQETRDQGHRIEPSLGSVAANIGVKTALLGSNNLVSKAFNKMKKRKWSKNPIKSATKVVGTVGSAFTKVTDWAGRKFLPEFIIGSDRKYGKGNTKGTAGKAGKKKNIFSRTKDKFNKTKSAFNTAKDIFNESKESIKNGFNSTGSATEGAEATAKAAGTASDVAEGTAKATSAASKATEGFESVYKAASAADVTAGAEKASSAIGGVGKAVDAAEDVAQGAKSTSIFGDAFNFVKSKAGKVVDAAKTGIGAAKTGINAAKSTVGGVVNSAKSAVGGVVNSAKSAVGGALDSVKTGASNMVGKAVNAAKGGIAKMGKKFEESCVNDLFKKFVTKVKDIITKFFGSEKLSGVVNKLTEKFGPKGARKGIKLVTQETLQRIGEKLAKFIGEKLSKTASKLILKATGKIVGFISTGAIVPIAMAAIGVYNGFNNANSIMGTTEQPTFITRLICGVTQAVNETFCLGLIDLESLFNAILSIFKGLGVFEESIKALEEEREESQETVDEYNRLMGTDLNISEYNKLSKKEKEEAKNQKDTAMDKNKKKSDDKKKDTLADKDKSTGEDKKKKEEDKKKKKDEKKKNVLGDKDKSTGEDKKKKEEEKDNKKEEDKKKKDEKKKNVLGDKDKSTGEDKKKKEEDKKKKEEEDKKKKDEKKKNVLGDKDKSTGEEQKKKEEEKDNKKEDGFTIASRNATAQDKQTKESMTFGSGRVSIEDDVNNKKMDTKSSLLKDATAESDDAKRNSRKKAMGFTENSAATSTGLLTTENKENENNKKKITDNILKQSKDTTDKKEESSISDKDDENGFKPAKTTAKSFYKFVNTKVKKDVSVLKKKILLASKIIDKNLGSIFFLENDRSKPLSLTEGIKYNYAKYRISAISGYTAVRKIASNTITSVKDKVSKSLKDFPAKASKALNILDENMGAYLGMVDESGKPLSITDAVKHNWNKLKNTATKAWEGATTVAKKVSTSVSSWVKKMTTGNTSSDSTATSASTNTPSSAVNTPSGRGSGLTGYIGGASGISTSRNTFVSQRDPRYVNSEFNTSQDTIKQTIGTTGCAPAAATMAINNTFGTNTTNMGEASKLALGYKAKNDGVDAEYFDNMYRAKGLEAEYYSGNNRNKIIMDSLKNGANNVVLLGQDPQNLHKSSSPFGPNPHYVTASGLSRDKEYIYIDDPESNRPSKKYKASKILNAVKLGIGVGFSKDKLLSNIRRNSFIGSGVVLPGKNNREKVWNYLKSKQFSDECAAGIIGNMMQEASTEVDPAILQGNGPGRGICQWTYGSDRWEGLVAMAASLGVDWTDLYAQCEFTWKEFNHEDSWNGYLKSAGLTPDEFRTRKDIDTSTVQFCEWFERAGSAMEETRIKYAHQAYQEFTGKSTPINTSITSADGTAATTTTSSKSETLLDKILGIGDKLARAYGLVSEEVQASTDGVGSTVSTEGITGTVSSNPQYAEKQKALVAQMKSVEGTLPYNQNNDDYPGTRNPDQGGGDCSSTVQWAYRKVLGTDIGDWTGAQYQDEDTYVVDTGYGNTGVPNESNLQLGDIVLYGNNASRHVEMYAGNGNLIGHGNPSVKGPTVKTMQKAGYKGDYWASKRYVGFRGSGSGLNGSGSGINYDQNNTVNNDMINGLELHLDDNVIESAKSNSGNNLVRGVKSTNNVAKINTTTITRKVNTTKSNSSMMELVKIIIQMMGQLVNNTSSIQTIVSLLSELITASESGDKKVVQDTSNSLKANLAGILSSNNQTTDSTKLQSLIESVSKIAAQ